ncbi:MAG: radical SAM protein [Planctomycetes bacterium]|nr:radical SAM protein [Planctomycetota bacterium]
MSKFYSFKQLYNYLLFKLGHRNSRCKNAPVQICLFVTDRCTLSCNWCLRQSDSSNHFSKHFNKTRPDLSLDVARKIMQYFPRAGHVNFAGFGEPLLNEDLFRINAEFKKHPMRTSIITNGTLLLDRIDEIIQAGFHYIEISINSLDAQNYLSTCGGDENTFNKIVRGIQSLAEKRKVGKYLLSLSFVLTRNLVDQLGEVIKFAEDIKVDGLTLHNLIPHNNYNDYTGVLTCDDDEVVAKISEWKRKNIKVKIDWPSLVRKGLERPARACIPLWNWIGIDMEGNTAGCHRAMGTNKEYGNLFKEGKNVWNNEFRKKLRESFLKRDKFLFDCCKTCVEAQP